MHEPILLKISIINFTLKLWNNSAKPTWNGLCFFPLCITMDDLKYSVTFGSMRKVTFGSIRKQNIEELLPWSRITCGIGLIADITVFCRIKCQFKMEFELVTLVTQSFRTYLLVVCWTQFFCYICAIDAGRVKHLQFSKIFRVREAYSVTKMVNTHILQPAVCVGDI